MTYLDIRLDDRRAAGPPDFSVLNPNLQLSADRRRAFSVVWRHQGVSEGKAIVLARNDRLIGYAYGYDCWGRAMDAAVACVKRTYGFYRWPLLPQSGVVALVRPFPQVRLDQLWYQIGVDTIITPERLTPDPKLLEQPWIDQWLGIPPCGSGNHKRIYILTHWKMKK